MKKQHYLYESCLEERTNTSNLNHVKIMDPSPNLRLRDLKGFSRFLIKTDLFSPKKRNRCFRVGAGARRVLDEKIYFQKIPEQLGQPPGRILNYGLFLSLTRGSPHFRLELFKIKNMNFE